MTVDSREHTSTGKTDITPVKNMLPMDDVRIARICLSKLTKQTRREMGKWLSKNLGRPDRNGGLWWTDDDGYCMLVCFRHDEAFVEFSLRYC